MIPLYGIEELRDAVDAFNFNRESFNTRYHAAELLKIRRAWRESEWDFYPDQWEYWQAKAALKGIVPKWDANQQPVKSKQKVKARNDK